MYADWRVAFHHDPCQPSPNYGILSRVAPPCALCSPPWSISPSWLEVERRCSVDLVEDGVTGRRCSRLRHSQARDRKQCGFGVAAAHIRDWDVKRDNSRAAHRETPLDTVRAWIRQKFAMGCVDGRGFTIKEAGRLTCV